MGNLLAWLVGIGLASVGLGVLAGSSLGMVQRSRFWLRVLLGYVAMLSLVLLVAGALVLSVLPENVLMLLWLALVVMSLAFMPTFCYRSAGSSPGSSDADGGGGPGPDHPPSSPTGPNGGVPLPLPDADQAIARARDHNRPQLRDVKPRRRAREPERTPTPRNGRQELPSPRAAARTGEKPASALASVAATRGLPQSQCDAARALRFGRA